MPMPEGKGAVDLMIGFPSANARSHDDYLRAMTKDAASPGMELIVDFANATDVFKLGERV